MYSLFFRVLWVLIMRHNLRNFYTIYPRMYFFYLFLNALLYLVLHFHVLYVHSLYYLLSFR